MKRYLLGAVLVGNCVFGMGSDVLDSMFADITKCNKEELVKNYSNINTDTEIGKSVAKAVADRYSKLTQMELQQEIAQAAAVPIYRATPVEQWTKEHVQAFIKDTSGTFSPCEDEFMEKFEQRCQELGMRPGASVPQTATPVASDSVKVNVSGEIPAFDQIENMNRTQLIDYQIKLLAKGQISPFIQSQIKKRLEVLNVTNIERDIAGDLKELDKIEQGMEKPKKGVTFADVPPQSTPVARPAQPKTQDVPAPLSTEDFVDAAASDELPDLSDAQPGLIGTDAQATPVTPGDDPLLKAPARPHSASPAPDKPDTPLAASASEPVSSADTKPATIRREPGRTTLPVVVEDTEPIAPTASREPSGDGSSLEKVRKQVFGEDIETPGGPDDSSGSDSDSGSGSNLPPKTPQSQDQLSTVQKSLIAAGVVAAVYGGTELVLAYKSIPEHEWKHTSGVLKKAKLVLDKAWENVKNRPSDLKHLLEKGKHSVVHKWHSLTAAKAGLDVRK